MFENLPKERIEAINREGARLQERINEALRTFKPSGSHVGYGRGFEAYGDPMGCINPRERGMTAFDGGLYEAEALAERMAAGAYEVRVRETIGGPQRFYASVMHYIGGR